MRARFLGCIVLVCLSVLSGFTPEEPRLQAYADADYDGIDDNLEASLAAQFLPTIWFAYSDSCLAPTSGKRCIACAIRRSGVCGTSTSS